MLSVGIITMLAVNDIKGMINYPRCAEFRLGS